MAATFTTLTGKTVGRSLAKESQTARLAARPVSAAAVRTQQRRGLQVLAQATAAPVREFKAAPIDRVVPQSWDRKKIGNRSVAVITGASSGLGLACAKFLAESGDWYVILACRDWLKAERQAKKNGMSKDSYKTMHLDLASLDSVRTFVDNFRRLELPLDVLVCNAAIYQPNLRKPEFTAEGFELAVGTNHLGHFLLSNLMLEDLQKSDHPNRRMVLVGSITGNKNTLAGNIPPTADLGDLRGLKAGLDGTSGSAMINGDSDFWGAKAYKDSKLCNMLTMRQFHKRFHEKTGITFNSMYPGCIAETGLFRQHVPQFRALFPVFMKYVTGGYVSEEVAGERLAQCVDDESLDKSGVYWYWQEGVFNTPKWRRNKGNNMEAYEQDLSDEGKDDDKGAKLWDLSMKLVGLA